MSDRYITLARDLQVEDASLFTGAILEKGYSSDYTIQIIFTPAVTGSPNFKFTLWESVDGTDWAPIITRTSLMMGSLTSGVPYIFSWGLNDNNTRSPAPYMRVTASATATGFNMTQLSAYTPPGIGTVTILAFIGRR
jgi:hypothetical protein